MVLLKEIFSETNLFDPVEFHGGINIIQGSYTKPKEELSDLNGIGKSTLVRLVDFALLSESSKGSFDIKKYGFLDKHSVTLVFEREQKEYRIRREFSNARKPRFMEPDGRFIAYDDVDLRKILGGMFFSGDDYDGVVDNTWFRTLIRFFIKDDINHFERRDPLKFSSGFTGRFESYFYNLFLLDLPNKGVFEFNSAKNRKEVLSKQKRKLIERISEETGRQIDEIRSEVVNLDSKIRAFENSISEFQFLETYKDIEKEIIRLSKDISVYLRDLNQLERKLLEIRRSYAFDFEFDKSKVIKLYTEISTLHGDTIERKLEEVIEFRERLRENRKKFLSERETEISARINENQENLATLEHQRSSLYKMLDQQEALDSVKATYTLLISERTKKERILGQVSEIDKLDDHIIKINEEITKIISQISGEFSEVKEKINDIHELYLEVVGKAIFVDEEETNATFDIRPDSAINSPLKISLDVPKSGALGKSRFKILAYDLTVFLNLVSSGRNLPQFLIHDGVFHGIDVKILVRILNYIHSEFIKNSRLQYIITTNEHETNIPNDRAGLYGKYDFEFGEAVIATYRDIPSEMIFKREY